MPNETMTATDFKNGCLALLDRVQAGGTVTITKRGRPVATFLAAARQKYPSSEGKWAALFPNLPEMEARDYDLPWENATEVAGSDRK